MPEAYTVPQAPSLLKALGHSLLPAAGRQGGWRVPYGLCQQEDPEGGSPLECLLPGPLVQEQAVPSGSLLPGGLSGLS